MVTVDLARLAGGVFEFRLDYQLSWPQRSMKTLTDYSAKVEALRRYRSTNDRRRASIEHGANAPMRVTLWTTSEEEVEFELSGNEIASLFSDFSDINSVQDLFADLL